MKRRDFIKTTGLAVGTIGLGSQVFSLSGCAPKKRKPNIIFIFADDLGYNELGCYGQTKIETPNIDKLAEEGMKFSQFYSGSAVCAPSRCNLLTGKHGGHAYIRNNGEIKDKEPGIFGGQSPIPPSEPTIAKTLKTAGYATGCFGKWGLGAVGTTGDPLNQGFDRFYGYNCQRHAHNLYPKYLVNDSENEWLEGNNRGLTGKTYAPQQIADEMLTFVKENKDNPLFVYYPTIIPHLALQVPDKYLKKYQDRWPDEPYIGGSYLPHPTPKACYAAMISFLDEQVGRLMSLLKELRLDEDTIVLFSSDNGVTHLKEQVDYEFFKFWFCPAANHYFFNFLYDFGIFFHHIYFFPDIVFQIIQFDLSFRNLFEIFFYSLPSAHSHCNLTSTSSKIPEKVFVCFLFTCFI